MRKKVFVAKSSPKYLFGLLILIPIALYYFTVFLFAVNVPLSDDFPAVLGFLGSFLSAAGISEKLRLLFFQHNEHRIVVNKLLTLALYKITGVIDFKLLIYLGNLLLLPAIYGVYLSFKKNKDKVKYFLPAVLIIMVPQFTGSIFWATSALQNISCLAFSILTLALLRKEGVFRSVYAFFLALLAVLSSGNGLFILPAAIILLMLGKRKLAAIWWSVGALLMLLGYFYGYAQPAHEGIYYAGNPLAVVEFFFCFIGSPVVLNVFYMKSLFGNNAKLLMLLLSGVLGAGVITYFIYLAKKKYYKVNPVIFTMFILLFISAFAAAVTRSGIGPMQAFASRYRLIPLFILALVYLSFIEMSKEKVTGKYYKYIVMLAVVFFVFSYISNLPAIKAGKENLLLGITGWQKDGTGLDRLNDHPVYADKQLKESVEKGIYNPEK